MPHSLVKAEGDSYKGIKNARSCVFYAFFCMERADILMPAQASVSNAFVKAVGIGKMKAKLINLHKFFIKIWEF